MSIKEKEGTKQKFVHTFRQILSLSLAVQFLLMIYRHEGLDRFIRKRLLMQPNSLRFVAATKVGIDGLLFGPLNLLTFSPCMSFAAGKSSSQVMEDVKRDFFPAFILEGGLWPLVQAANFQYVPVLYQLLQHLLPVG